MIGSLLILLHLAGIISQASALTSLYIAGILLIFLELAVVSFGIIAFNGILALYAAYTLQTGSDIIFGIPVGFPFLFGIAFVEILAVIAIVAIHLWLRSLRTTTGVEGMIGQAATILEWSGTEGMVRFEGETWKAKSEQEMDFDPDDKVTIESVGKMDILISA